MGAAEGAIEPGLEARRLSSLLLAALAILAALVLLAGDPHVLVELSSDRDGQALLPVSTLAPGSAVAGSLTLGNEGLLPLRYDLRVEGGRAELAGGVVIRIRRSGAPGYLYQGALSDRPIPIGTLLPGQRDHLEVTLAAPAGESTASLPVDDTFVWTAHSPGLDSWWWLLLVAGGLLLAAFALPRLLAAWSWLRSRRRLPFELYWRTPLVLALLLVATLVPLAGGSLSTVNAQSSNPGAGLGVGTLVLSDQAPTRTTCLSMASETLAAGAGTRCDAIFRFDEGEPGSTRTARVTIRNAGTAGVSTFGVYTAGCRSQVAPAGYTGGGDGCSAVLMAIHDDRHDRCYFPVAQPGPCPAAGASLADFAAAHPAATPLALDAGGLGAGIPFTFTLQVDPASGNRVQGLQPLLDLTWRVSQ